MAALLAIHGLATPGIILPYNGLVGFTGAATLPIGGAVLALSALPVASQAARRRPPPHPPGVDPARDRRARHRVHAPPLAAEQHPEARGPGRAGGARRRGRLLRRPPPPRAADLPPHPTSRRPRRGRRLGMADGRRAAGDAAHLVGSGLVARPPARAVGIVAVGVQVALDLRRSAQSRPLSGDLLAAELVAEEEAFLGARVRALTMHLAEKDVSTEEHTRRVAMRAVQVGEELGLPPHRLRAARDRRPAPRHRQAQRPGRDPEEARPADRRRVRRRQAPPRVGSQAARRARRLRRHRPPARARPPRAARRRRVPARDRRRTSSSSTPGSSPCATSTTRSSRPASTVTPGRTSRRSPCYASRRARRSTTAASPRSSGSSPASARAAGGRRLAPGLLRAVGNELGREAMIPEPAEHRQLRRLLHSVVHRVDQRDAGLRRHARGRPATCSWTKSSRQFVAALPVTYVSQPRSSDASRISTTAPPPATMATRPASPLDRVSTCTRISGPRYERSASASPSTVSRLSPMTAAPPGMPSQIGKYSTRFPARRRARTAARARPPGACPAARGRCRS